METIALEWVGSSEVEPWDVVKFVQQLDNVPQDAVCEIGDIFSRRYRAGSKFCRNQEEVVDAQEAYEFFADSDAPAPQRMTLLGLSNALAKLR
ncbi:unnamed protein product [Phytophthora lilii]|uniref:Unnamed protein product n=1 Tax=Phytophthora lilii TaxID=2077276 RepID=A0A9W6TI68_9STRA|nr:unnamed protein product [Phytophthora lilii]